MSDTNNPLLNRVTRQAETYFDEVQKHKEQVKVVRGAIIGALAGGHMDGPNVSSYSKSVLLQIADLLEITLPEKVRETYAE